VLSLNNAADPKYVPKQCDFIDELRFQGLDMYDLELQGVKFPEKETCLGDLTAQQIVEKIDSFHNRLTRESHLGVAPFAESYFLNLMGLYPVSMCSCVMSDKLKLVAALFYFGSQSVAFKKRKHAESDCKDLFPIVSDKGSIGYTYDDLALIFDRSRAVILAAVKQKRRIAKVILEEAAIRYKTKETVLDRIVEENKEKKKCF
jgi:hypothetical protein